MVYGGITIVASLSQWQGNRYWKANERQRCSSSPFSSSPFCRAPTSVAFQVTPQNTLRKLMSHANRVSVRMTGTTKCLRTVGSSSSLIMIHRHTARLIVYRSFTSSFFAVNVSSVVDTAMHMYFHVAFSFVFILFDCYFMARFFCSIRFPGFLFAIYFLSGYNIFYFLVWFLML